MSGAAKGAIYVVIGIVALWLAYYVVSKITGKSIFGTTGASNSYMGYTLTIASQPNYNINNDTETMSVLKDYLHNTNATSKGGPLGANNQAQADYTNLNNLGTWKPALPVVNSTADPASGSSSSNSLSSSISSLASIALSVIKL